MDVTDSDLFWIEPTEVMTDPETDDNLALLYLAESESRPLRYVSMSLSLDDHEFYLEVNDQGRSCYDCLADTTFFSQGVVMHLKPEAASALAGVRRIAISLRKLPLESANSVMSMLATKFSSAMQPIPTFGND